jgi:hypothetical protein
MLIEPELRVGAEQAGTRTYQVSDRETSPQSTAPGHPGRRGDRGDLVAMISVSTLV